MAQVPRCLHPWALRQAAHHDGHALCEAALPVRSPLGRRRPLVPRDDVVPHARQDPRRAALRPELHCRVRAHVFQQHRACLGVVLTEPPHVGAVRACGTQRAKGLQRGAWSATEILYDCGRFTSVQYKHDIAARTRKHWRGYGMCSCRNVWSTVGLAQGQRWHSELSTAIRPVSAAVHRQQATALCMCMSHGARLL